MSIRRVAKVLAAVLVTVGSQPGAMAGNREVIIPVVTRGASGSSGSFWASEVRVLRLRGGEPLAVRRAWVATAAGGQRDQSATAPEWRSDTGFMLILTGEDLLAGVTASHAAVGLTVPTEAEVWWRNADTGGQGRLPEGDPAFRPCCLPGAGQLGPALSTPLVGPSVIPWMTSGNGVFRVNVGLVNPSAAPLVITVAAAYLFSGQAPLEWAPGYQTDTERVTVTLPPWGWRQLNNLLFNARPDCAFPACPWLTKVAPVAGRIVPAANDRPYFAFASVLFTPRNDPEFVVAVPGQLPPTLQWP